MAEETARSKWRRYRPAMDFTRVSVPCRRETDYSVVMQAKIILELNSSLKPEELDKEEVHKKFINQLAKVLKIVLE